MGNVHMEARQVNYRGGEKPMSVEEAIKAGSGYTLPAATAETLGGIKVGDNLTIENGVLSAPDPYEGATYSSEPVVVGKWIDNTTVKMRVYSFEQPLEVSNSTWTSTGLTLANSKLLKCFGVNNGNTCYPLLGSIDENNVIKLSVGRTTSGAAIDELIIEYAESEE